MSHDAPEIGRSTPRTEVAGGAEVPRGASDSFLGVLLAGGRSERMGRPKAALPWGSGRMMDAGLAALREVCDHVGVAPGGESDLRALVPEREGLVLVEDALEGAGPLAAICGALERAAELGAAGAIVLACDMPLVTAEELLPLTRAVGAGADAALWRVEGVVQPLCAAYSVSLAPAARAALEAGSRRPVAILGGTAAKGRRWSVTELDPGQNSAVRLMNVNTGTDYDLALKRAR